jgi:transketolase
MKQQRIIELKIIAKKIRRHVVEGVYYAECGHPGGSLSIADLLSLLYFKVMNVDPKNPQLEERPVGTVKGALRSGTIWSLGREGLFSQRGD